MNPPLICSAYVPPLNKKSLHGFLANNDLDEFYTCEHCGAGIQSLSLLRPLVPVNLEAWLVRLDPYENFSITFKYKCHAAKVFCYPAGETERTVYSYGCGPLIKGRLIEYSGISPVRENVKS